MTAPRATGTARWVYTDGVTYTAPYYLRDGWVHVTHPRFGAKAQHAGTFPDCLADLLLKDILDAARRRGQLRMPKGPRPPIVEHVRFVSWGTDAGRLERIEAQMAGLLAAVVGLLAVVPADKAKQVQRQLYADLEGLQVSMLNDTGTHADDALAGLAVLRQALGS